MLELEEGYFFLESIVVNGEANFIQKENKLLKGGFTGWSKYQIDLISTSAFISHGICK